MGKKAVDIALLPSGQMADIAIAANRRLAAEFSDKIVLSADGARPHISLAMGVIDESNVGEIGAILSDIALRFPVGRLRIVGVGVSGSFSGEKVSVFEVERGDEIQTLHESIMLEVGPYLGEDSEKEMFFGGDEIGENTLRWVKNYRKGASFENFSPHITIGYGQLSGIDFPIDFTVSRLGLCHLGNHCTCRDIILSVDIGEKEGLS